MLIGFFFGILATVLLETIIVSVISEAKYRKSIIQNIRKRHTLHGKELFQCPNCKQFVGELGGTTKS